MTSFIKLFFYRDIECEYKLKCDAYSSDSYTCTKEIDKDYCGKRKEFS